MALDPSQFTFVKTDPSTAPQNPFQQYMQGWGGVSDPYAAQQQQSTTGNVGLPSSISDEAMRAAKGIKKLRDASGFNLGHIASGALQGFVTGGPWGALAGAAVSAAGDAFGASKMHGGLKQYRKWKNEYLPQMGWTNLKSGGWAPPGSTTKASTSQIVQALMDAGHWGGGTGQAPSQYGGQAGSVPGAGAVNHNPLGFNVAGMPPQGFVPGTRAQDWMTQAFASPYMQGWGNPTPPPQQPGNTGIVPPPIQPSAPPTAMPPTPAPAFAAGGVNPFYKLGGFGAA